MADYRFLKDRLSSEKNKLISRQYDLQSIIDQHTRKEKLVIDASLDRANYPKLIGKLNKSFPEYNKHYEAINNLHNYLYLIKNKKIDAIDPDKMEKELDEAFKLFNEKLPSIVKMIKRVIVAFKSMDKNSKKREKFLNDASIANGHNLYGIIEDIYISVTDKMTDMLKKALEEQRVDDSVYRELKEIENKLLTIDRVNKMFSMNEFLVDIKSEDDIHNVVNLVKPFVTNEESRLLLTTIKEEIREKEEKEKKPDTITILDLDLTMFNEEERNVIEELREILGSEELIDEEEFSDVEISLKARETCYKEAGLNRILLDANYLANHIFENKEEVIKIYKVIIEKYKKYNLGIVRNNQIIELVRIKRDLENIVSFINKNIIDREKSYKNEQLLSSFISSIDNELIPLIKEMIDKDMDYDEFYDNEIDEKINLYKRTIKRWKKAMSLSYIESYEEENKEETDNLVFCIADVDLSTQGFDKEFIGTIEALESRSSQDLKKRPGRRGMSRIRKSTENGKEKDFVEYLESKYKVKLHFVPYRYSSEPDYRTGLIKFEPSQTVKEYLEDFYGLSKQSAYYGVFLVISAKGANHNEYAFFENYILNNFKYIEEIASLFASDNPDFDKLTKIIDDMLLKKKNILSSLQNTMN